MSLPEIRFAAEVEFKCPFCGRTVAASSKEGAVLHAVPMCEKFEKLEPDEYMHQVNVILGNYRNVN